MTGVEVWDSNTTSLVKWWRCGEHVGWWVRQRCASLLLEVWHNFRRTERCLCFDGAQEIPGGLPARYRKAVADRARSVEAWQTFVKEADLTKDQKRNFKKVVESRFQVRRCAQAPFVTAWWSRAFPSFGQLLYARRHFKLLSSSLCDIELESFNPSFFHAYGSGRNFRRSLAFLLKQWEWKAPSQTLLTSSFYPPIHSSFPKRQSCVWNAVAVNMSCCCSCAIRNARKLRIESDWRSVKYFHG